MGLHVRHLAVVTVSQPGEQPGFGGRQIDAGHPDLGESKLACPGPDPGQQERTIDLTTAIRHAAIVGTPERRLVWRDEEGTRAFAERLAASPALADASVPFETLTPKPSHPTSTSDQVVLMAPEPFAHDRTT